MVRAQRYSYPSDTPPFTIYKRTRFQDRKFEQQCSDFYLALREKREKKRVRLAQQQEAGTLTHDQGSKEVQSCSLGKN